MAQPMSSRKRKAVEALLDRNAELIHQLAGAARTRVQAEPTEDEAALATEARENLANISLALPPQALAGPQGQAERFARTARGMGMLPQYLDYEPGMKRQLQAKQQEASREPAQQTLLQHSQSILQGLAAQHNVYNGLTIEE
ncbi:hypothetical protein WJX84_004186 [Apatococcus fuscideae]|uniref:DUF7797 domain-containing protein n=1 Tax=Apatococcus fuscideae TaxID=2026836 RepID=A0AAW1T0H7_9CHLO